MEEISSDFGIPESLENDWPEEIGAQSRKGTRTLARFDQIEAFFDIQ